MKSFVALQFAHFSSHLSFLPLTLKFDSGTEFFKYSNFRYAANIWLSDAVHIYIYIRQGTVTFMLIWIEAHSRKANRVNGLATWPSLETGLASKSEELHAFCMQGNLSPRADPSTAPETVGTLCVVQKIGRYIYCITTIRKNGSTQL